MRIRSYACNLLFRDRPDPIADSENDHWVLHGRDGMDFHNPSLMGLSNRGFTTMKVSKEESFIQNERPLDLRRNWQYTISLRYRIDQDWMGQMITESSRVPGLVWDDGCLMLYDHREANDIMCLSLTMGKVRIETSIDYESFGPNQPIHLLIGMKRMEVVGIVNGVLHFRQYHKDPTYVFRNLKMGNFLEEEAAKVEFDELCMVDDFVYSEGFRIPTKPFHSLYPEETIDDDATHHIGVATNGLIRVNESNQDRIGKLDIVRHVDYEPPQTYRTDRKRKYEYQYEGLEDDVASYHETKEEVSTWPTIERI